MNDVALTLFAAFNNVRPDQLSEAQKFHPNGTSQAAWERVAEAARYHFAGACVTVGYGLEVYGSIEALQRVQAYIMLDSTHPIEAADVRRNLAKALQEAEEKLARFGHHL